MAIAGFYLTNSVQQPTIYSMANHESTERDTQQETKRPQVTASCELWDAFERWAAKFGFSDMSEAFRQAMIEVTQFNPNSQEKSGPGPTAR